MTRRRKTLLPERSPDAPQPTSTSVPAPVIEPAPRLPARAADEPERTRVVVPDASAVIEARIAAQQRAKQAWAPHLEPDAVPPGYKIRGTSILRDGDGNVRLVWHKTTSDSTDPFELGEKIAAGLNAGGLVPLEPIEPPPVANEDLLSVYVAGDPHVGLYCWAQECGESFDLDIAARQYLAVAQCLIPRAPAGGDALVIELGDFFHADDPEYRTSSGRHTVDVDTRYDRVITTGIRIMQTLVDALLLRHQNVTVWCLRGNHDDRSTLTLREALRGYYAHNPRVTIDATPGKWHFREFGSSLIGATHGDQIKGKRGRTAHEVFTTDQRQAWGRTLHSRCYVGHVHHESASECGTLVTETFRTLAPRDAWHTSKGYRSGRDIRLDVWHRDYGFRERHIAPANEIENVMRGPATRKQLDAASVQEYAQRDDADRRSDRDAKRRERDREHGVER